MDARGPAGIDILVESAIVNVNAVYIDGIHQRVYRLDVNVTADATENQNIRNCLHESKELGTCPCEEN